jgi:hypothetical protein
MMPPAYMTNAARGSYLKFWPKSGSWLAVGRSFTPVSGSCADAKLAYAEGPVPW